MIFLLHYLNIIVLASQFEEILRLVFESIKFWKIAQLMDAAASKNFNRFRTLSRHRLP